MSANLVIGENTDFSVVVRGGVGWGWVSLVQDKIEPIAVVSFPRQCFYYILGNLDCFTVKGGLESCIAELAKG